MAKESKEFIWRMQGMQYALGIVQKEGVQALEEDLRKRGFYCNADIVITKKQIDDWIENLSRNIYNNVLCAVAWVLNQHYGFGKQRLHNFRKQYDQEMSKVLDYNYMGNKYVSLADYAEELNSKYDLGINKGMAEDCEGAHDKEMKAFLQSEEWLKGVISTLNGNGYTDAAEFLNNKLEENKKG